jgi:uncharacterized protein YcgI (DUF1989 family)
MKATDAAYRATTGGALDVDHARYDRIAAAQRTTVESFVLPIRSGRAWEVPAGHLCRITAVEGPQVGDLNIWNRHDPRERMWAAKTRQLQAAHVTVYDRLWSTLPYLRPLVTIVGDSLRDYGVDSDGGRVHDLLGSRCDPYTNLLLSAESFDFHCHSNLTRAVLPYGLTEFDVHDVLNVFQVTGLNEEDKYYNKACPAAAGDFFEFFAEIDLLCALSTCPGGDLSVPQWGPDAGDPLETCKPLGVEVFRPDIGALEGWTSPQRSEYRGFHGFAQPAWQNQQDQPDRVARS